MFLKFLQKIFTTNHQALLLGIFFLLTTFFPLISLAQANNPVAALGGWVGASLAWLVYGIALGIGGMITGLGAVLLDLSFLQVVLNFGELAGPQSDLGIGVQGLWQVVRDILNILFIFGFIYMGIRTILNSEDSGTRRTLGLLIIAALMINFSLYITQVVVDFSNIAAVQIYNQISFQGNENTTKIIGLFPVGQGSISSAFLDVAGVSSIFGSLPSGVDAGKIMIFSIFMMIFLIIAGIVFAMGAFLLISRFIALVIYMILSPVMFLGFILPSLAGKQKEWWGGFLKQAFFAPAFLFMLYLSLVVLQRLRGVIGISSDTAFTDMVGGNEISGGFFTMLLFYIMMIGFLYASIKVAQAMGVAGASGSLKALDSMGKAARGAAQGFAYRTTVGFGLSGLVKGMDALDRRAESEKGTPGRRRAQLARTILGGEATRRSLEKGANYGAGGGQGRADVEKDKKTRSERASTGRTANDLRTKIRQGVGGTNIDEKIAMEAALSSASVVDLVKLAENKEGFELLQKVAGNLPEKKFESLMDSKDLSPDQKSKISAGRIASVKTHIAGGSTVAADFQKGLTKASAEELNALDFKDLMDNAMYIQSGQLDKLESKWGDEKMRIFKAKRKKDIIDEFQLSPGTILDSRKDEKEIAKLPTEIFTAHSTLLLDELVAKNKLTGGLMKHIEMDSGMSGLAKKNFGTAVKARYGTNWDSLPPDLQGFFRSSAGASFGSISI